MILHDRSYLQGRRNFGNVVENYVQYFCLQRKEIALEIERDLAALVL